MSIFINGKERLKPINPVLVIQFLLCILHLEKPTSLHIVKLSHQGAELLCNAMSYSIPQP